MVRYFIKRLGMMLIAMFLIVLLTFTIMHAIPMGILAAVKNGKWQDMLVMAFATVA